MDEELKQKFLDFFQVRPHERRPFEQKRFEETGQTTLEEDGWGMLNYLLDNLHLDDAQLVEGLMSYTDDPKGRKNHYLRIDWAVRHIRNDNSVGFPEGWEPYATALREDGSPFYQQFQIPT